MRVSTSMMYNSGLRGILNLQSELYKAQNQLSTGRRILTPADDPIGASEALEISQSQGVNKQFMNNQSDAEVQLTLAESIVGSVGDTLLRLSELAEQAGNPTYSEAQRGMLVAEMKLNLQTVIGLANTQDGTGLHIFAGTKTWQEPFAVNTGATPPASGATVPAYGLSNTHVTYSGDAGAPTLQVTASKTMAVSESGMEVFMQVRDAQGNVVGQSMFDTIKNLIDLVDPASGMSFSTAELEQVQKNMKSTIDHVANVRATLGARLNAVDGLKTTASDINYLYDVRLSELQDLDYAEAISRYTRYQTQLEATQLTFKQTSQLSLFSIL